MALTLDIVLRRFKLKHKDKFDYSKFEYEAIKSLSIVICKSHNNSFKISSADHLRYESGGCKKCYNEHSSKQQRMSIETYILKANSIHNYKYDYSLIHQFKNQHEIIKIICPIHGEFPKEAANHINKKLKQGCPICGEDRGAKKRRLTKNDFVKKSMIIHNNFYDYSLVNYKTDRVIVSIICPVHGEFQQVARNHLDGYGCFDCSLIKRGNTSRKSNANKFIKMAKRIHGKKFDYSKLVWVNSDTPVEIICKKCGPFWIIPHNHTSPSLKRGCTICGKKMRIRQNLWLDYLGIPNDKKSREVTIKINSRNYKVDGYEDKTKTIYEFNGDYWHGNPKKFKAKDINPTIGISFGFLYKKTLEKKRVLKKAGYKVISIWESDWDKISSNLH